MIFYRIINMHDWILNSSNDVKNNEYQLRIQIIYDHIMIISHTQELAYIFGVNSLFYERAPKGLNTSLNL